MASYARPMPPSRGVYMPPRPTKVSTAPFDDWCAGYDPVSEKKLVHSGLRGTQLCIVTVCLGLLWILAVITTACNIILITSLGISPQGMRSMQFYRTTDENGDTEHVVRFTGENIDLGTVVSNGGVVGGHKDKSLTVQGSRLLLKTNFTEPEAHVGALVMEDGRIRLDGANSFETANARSGNYMYRSDQPIFDTKDFETIAATQIITNKVRSPLDTTLKFDVDNLSFRGNEGNKFRGKNIKWQALNNIEMRTVKSSAGAIRFNAAQGFYLNAAEHYPLSSSPALTARELGFRLCACLSSKRLFKVPGHLDCKMPDGYCY